MMALEKRIKHEMATFERGESRMTALEERMKELELIYSSGASRRKLIYGRIQR